MNAIEALEQNVREAVPKAWTRLRRPRNPQGQWWLDTKMDGHVVTIAWSPRRGFGISSSSFGDGYGEGAEETYEERQQATARVIELLASQQHTVPPDAVLLQELRGLVGLTQGQVAEKLGVQQAAVSRFERREDITLSALRRYVAAIGADLEINVRMANGEQMRLAGVNDEKRSRVACDHVEGGVPLVKNSFTQVVRGLKKWRAWLGEYSAVVGEEWGPPPQVSVKLSRSVWEPLASIEGDGLLRLNEAKVRGLAEEFQKTKDFRWASAEAAWYSVSRYLLAHEFGHLLDAKRSPLGSSDRILDDVECHADAVAGWIGGRLGDDAALGSSIASRLGCSSIGCRHPTMSERSYAYLLGHSAGSRVAARRPSIHSMVIRTSNLERLRAFYSTLGLELVEEKHGTGPLHYSCSMDETVMEIYPTKRPVTGGNRLELRLRTPMAAIERLQLAGYLPNGSAPLNRETSPLSFMVHDPDGNELELSAS